MRRSKAKEVEKVLELSSALPPISLEERQEALHRYAIIYAGKTIAWCSCCGLQWTSDLWNNKRIKKDTCPYCRATGRVVRNSKKAIHDDKYYFSLVRVVEGWQVIRTFFCEIYSRKGDAGSPLRWFIKEACQTWMTPGVEPIFLGRSVKGCLGGACDLWRWETSINLKYDHYRYRISTAWSKNVQLHPQIKRNGFKTLRTDFPVVKQLEKMMDDHLIEILAKGKQWKMVEAYLSQPYHVRGYWNEIRICMRHKYMISRPSMWMDVIDQLRELGKDTHNPHYICPDNLKLVHDKMMAKIRKAQKEFEKKQKEAERIKLMKDNEKYRNRLGKLLDIVVEADGIVLRPLQDVEDFKIEGDELRHCVYTNKYYQKEGILIIGAKVNGKRTETIELELKLGKILQCRAKCNGVSDRHEDILSLMTENIHKFCSAVV